MAAIHSALHLGLELALLLPGGFGPYLCVIVDRIQSRGDRSRLLSAHSSKQPKRRQQSERSVGGLLERILL